MARIDPERFREFSEPGWAKAAFNFRVEEVEGRTVLTTVTRVFCTDEGARRRFRRYWMLIRPGSGAIRVAWLRAIRRRGGHPPPSSSVYAKLAGVARLGQYPLAGSAGSG
jgi:hypothetical protein